MTAQKRGLGRGLERIGGRGLDSLIPKAVNIEETVKNTDENNGIVMLKIGNIEPDRNQPRKNFSQDELEQLAGSIKSHGIFQPLLVQKKGNYYEIVAGERRWRAAKLAGLKEVPVIVSEYNEQERVEIQLLENVQREGLNPIEEANAYKRLIDDYGMKQDELAGSIGKNRSTITNLLRLLNLDEEIQQMLIENRITQGHARALLSMKDEEAQKALAREIIEKNMSVREAEKAAKNFGKTKARKAGIEKFTEAEIFEYRKMEERLSRNLSAKVNLKPVNTKKGRIEIEYNSQQELEVLSEKLGFNMEKGKDKDKEAAVDSSENTESMVSMKSMESEAAGAAENAETVETVESVESAESVKRAES